jgi:flagellin-like hook-associated protein FlgL
MSVTGIGSRSASAVQSLVDMRNQLDDLQRQLGTGKKSDTYAGLGLDRGFTVGLRAQVAAIGSYDDTITNVGVRLNLAQTALGRIDDVSHTIKSDAYAAPSIQGDGSTIAQSSAYTGLDEILGLLNTQAGDRYLFSGRATDQPAVETLDHIMNGDGARAGFKQIVDERKQADLGANNLGRLSVTAPTLTSVQVAEDATTYGLKLAGVNSTLTGATVTGPSGSPAVASVDLPVNPNAGDSIRFSFNLPDGTSENITLTATTSSPPGPNQFTIGATSDVTASNLQTALTTAIGKLADTSLTAASAVAAANDFFGDPPQRVGGPSPLTSAAGPVAGTPANTVIWYTGEDGADPARGTATARIDNSVSVSYGVRANEQGLRWVVQNMAALAAMTFSPTDPNAAGRAAALGQRVGTNLDVPAGTQKVSDIEADLAGAQASLKAATDRHQQTNSTLSDLLNQIEGVPPEQVGAEILALQTSLQASLQTTSLLYKTSLVNYI